MLLRFSFCVGKWGDWFIIAVVLVGSAKVYIMVDWLWEFEGTVCLGSVNRLGG